MKTNKVNTVKFTFDLGEISATYTGIIEGRTGTSLKVTYYEPSINGLYSIDLPVSQALSRGQQPNRRLPLEPTYRRNNPQPRKSLLSRIFRQA